MSTSFSSYPSIRKWAIGLALAFLFGLGAVIRFYDLTDLPLDFHPTRQLHSAMIARGMYYQQRTDVPGWQRDMAVSNWKSEGLIEPPLIEALVALVYRVTGSEQLWYARVASILFWLAGGIALFKLAGDVTGPGGALIALAYFLILPYGALASRSFQPDPLMTAVITAALAAMVHWEQKPGLSRAITAGLLSGLAILVKAVAIFFIGGAWVGVVLGSIGLRQALRSRQVWLIAILTTLPYACYHIYGVYISGAMASQFSMRFFPQLWVDPVFYLRWKNMIASTTGFPWFIVALLSTFLVQKPAHRWMLVGMWSGYFLYGMSLSYHISTHDYYQLPLIPLVALGLGAGAQVLLQNIRGPRLLLSVVVLTAVLFVLATEAWDVRVTLKRDDYRSEQVFWEKLGRKLGENVSVVALTQDYGYRLSYWGWVDSENWMTSSDFNLQSLAGNETDTAQMFAGQVKGKDFFVVTMLGELDRQPKLKSLLYSGYAVMEETSDLVIFDLHRPLHSVP